MTGGGSNILTGEQQCYGSEMCVSKNRTRKGFVEDMALTPVLPGRAEGGHVNNQRETPGHWSGKI